MPSDLFDCDVWNAMGVPDSNDCMRRRVLTALDRRAVSGYEHLEDDPWAEGVWTDEDGKERRGSVSHLLRWRQPVWNEGRALVERTLASLHTAGVIADSSQGGQRPTLEGSSTAHRSLITRWGGLDTRYADPTQFLAWPAMDGFAVPKPQDVPRQMPIPARVRPAWITSKVLNRAQFGREAMVEAITAIYSGIVEMCRGVNASPAFNPAVSFGLTYPQEIGGDNPPLDAAAQELKGYVARGITAQWRDYWTRIRHKAFVPPSPLEDPARATFRGSGVFDPVWNISEEQRVKVYTNRGSEAWQGDHLVTDCADAVQDFQEAVQLGRFMLDLGPSSLFYSTVQYHRVLYELSRARLGIGRDIAPAAYLALMQREQAKRQRRGLVNAAALITQGQYQLKDNDGVGDVIAKGAVATLASAVAIGQAAAILGAGGAVSFGIGAIAAAVLIAVAVLVGFLSDEAPIRRADEHSPVDNPGASSEWATNQHTWYQMGQVLQARPVIDWRPA